LKFVSAIPSRWEPWEIPQPGGPKSGLTSLGCVRLHRDVLQPYTKAYQERDAVARRVRTAEEKEDRRCLENSRPFTCADPKPNSYKPAEVNMIYTAAFAEREPAAAAFLNSVAFGNDLMNAVLAWQEDNKAEAAQAAVYFAVTYPDVWKTWVTPEAAEKVAAALGQ
jgi:ABC-type proline/glycine betaine transport system substrate-binding protein